MHEYDGIHFGGLGRPSSDPHSSDIVIALDENPRVLSDRRSVQFVGCSCPELQHSLPASLAYALDQHLLRLMKEDVGRHGMKTVVQVSPWPLESRRFLKTLRSPQPRRQHGKN